MSEGYYGGALKDKEWLLKEIENVFEAWQDKETDYVVCHSFHSMAYEVLTKVREAVKKAELTKQICEYIYEYPHTFIHRGVHTHLEVHTHGDLLKHVAETQNKAALKALGVNDD